MSSAPRVEQAHNQAQVIAHVGAEASKVGFAAYAVSAAVVGCWAVACLFAGTLSSGGVSGVLSDLAKAISGSY